MKEWIKNGLKKALTWIILVILAGVIWELFRPIYTAAIAVIGQTGNYFVNLYYAVAAAMSLPDFIGIGASCIVGVGLGCYFSFLHGNLKFMKRIERGTQQDLPDTEKLLKKIKFLMGISVIMIAIFFISFHIYILSSFMLKNRFDRKMVIMQAVIPEEQVNELNARWGLMRSKQDYDRLMNDIKKLEDLQKDRLEKLSAGE